MIDISIIVPHKNRFENFYRCFKSIIKHTPEDLSVEVVVGSLDDLSEEKVLRGLINSLYCPGKHNRIDCNVINSPSKTWNPSKARNIALNRAAGEVIILLDCDLKIDEKFIIGHYNACFSNKNSYNIGSMSDYFEFSTDSRGTYGGYDSRWFCDLNKVPLKWAMCWTANISFRRDLIDKGYTFDQQMSGWGAEDDEYAYRIANLAKYDIMFHKHITAEHTPHDRDIIANLKNRNKNYDYFYEKYKDEDILLVKELGGTQLNKIRMAEKNGTPLNVNELQTVKSTMGG